MGKEDGNEENLIQASSSRNVEKTILTARMREVYNILPFRELFYAPHCLIGYEAKHSIQSAA